MGVIALTFGYFMIQQKKWAFVAGLIQTIFLIGVFAWRGTISFFSVMEIVQNNSGDPFGKGIAFLVINAMFLMSLVVTAIQVMYFKSNMDEIRSA